MALTFKYVRLVAAIATHRCIKLWNNSDASLFGLGYHFENVILRVNVVGIKSSLIRNNNIIMLVNRQPSYLGGHVGECGALVGKRLVVHNVPVKYIELVVGHGVEVSQYGAFVEEMSRGVYHYPAVIVSRFVRYLGHLVNGILKYQILSVIPLQ